MFKKFFPYIRNEVFYFEQFYNLLFVIVPGVLCAYLFNNSYFNLASFFAVASVIPYGMSHHSRLLCYGKLFLTAMFSYIFLMYPNEHFYYWVIILLLSILFGFLEANMSKLKSLSSWLFISMLYGVVLMQSYSIQVNEQSFWPMLAIGLGSTTLYFVFVKDKPIPINAYIHFEIKEIFHYLKYFIYLMLGVLILNFGGIDQTQWFLWSGLSVLSLRLDTTIAKLKHRIFSGFIGVLLGLLIIQVLPTGAYLSIISYIGILLSLKVFRKYPLNFATRCFFIVLLAGNSCLSIGGIRLLDVVFGGLLGLLCSVALSYIDKKLNAKIR